MKPMSKPTDLGANRTGLAAHPKHGEQLIEGARQGVPAASFDLRPLESVRLAYEHEAGPVGTMPIPTSAKAAINAAGRALQGEKVSVLIDQMAARLAFERTGTRLYEALLTKFHAAEQRRGGPILAELQQIRDDELAHAALLVEGLERLGADPTAMTPAADVGAVASEGILKVLLDARTTFSQSLEAILVAELADNEAWSLLGNLAEKLGEEELATRFRDALWEEQDHLERVRAWLQSSVEGDAGVADEGPDAPAPARASP